MASKSKIKGGVVGSAKKFKKATQRSGGGGQYLKRIPEDGLMVRFLTEPEGFVEYHERYDENADPRYFPCTEETFAHYEGGKPGDRPSKRFLAAALDIDNNEVVPVVLPTTVAKELDRYYDKYGTLLDRDYELTRDGKGKETSYKAFSEDPKRRKGIDKLDVPDLWKILEEQLARFEEWLSGASDDADDDDDDDDDEVVRTRRGTTKKKRPVDDDDDDDDDEPVKKKKKSKGIENSSKTKVKKRRVSK